MVSPRPAASAPPLLRSRLARAVALALLALAPACSERAERSPAPGAGHSPWNPLPEATFVGGESCRACHENEYRDWLQSDHHQAMLPATEETVLGDFDDVVFEHHGQTWRFYRKAEEFWVHAPDEDGTPADFKIDYIFGHDPLQQYLIPFPGGRYQALQVCWDSRPAEEGGQRWYHLYPDEPIPPEDPLHWTRLHFNWNYMCADCHSTNLKKDFDPAALSYHTTWSSVNVSCEACHGPGSEHVKWAQAHLAAGGAGEGGAPDPDLAEVSGYLRDKGLVITLKEPEEAGWAVDPETLKPYRTAPLASSVQLDTCARCHSHRQLLEPRHVAGQPYLDTHLPSVLSDALYHHDGQMDEEVFVYGSFVQSKMHHAGVRCTDCHHPHTMKPLAAGNALCNRCHVPEKYDSPAHHFHPPGSTGASCVECHMPHVTYMVVDDRRDHSLRVPRPDLSEKLGTPNACTQCHQDQTAAWAAEHFHAWWGEGPREAHFGEILAAARRAQPGSMERLAALATDPARPGIVRATALHDMARMPLDQDALRAAATRLEDPDPLVRHHAMALLERLPPEERLRLVGPALSDPSRAVRVEAARILAPAAGRMGPEDRAAFIAAAREYQRKLEAISDRAAGHMGLALFHQDLNRPAETEAAYRKAIEVEPDHVPSRVNLAETLYQQGRLGEAEDTFRGAVEAATMEENQGVAREALARFFIRQKRYEEGLAELQQAALLLPGDARTQYFLGVALNSMDRFDDALPHLRKASELEPSNAEYLAGLATICRDAGRWDEALSAAEALVRLSPGDPQAMALLEQIRRSSR